MSVSLPNRVDFTAINRTRAACFLICTGQSNGDGTQTLPAAEQMDSLENVFMLSRETAVSGNTWTDESTWVWSSFSSQANRLNLGYRQSGHYKNCTTEFAREWQRRITAGEPLPNLYIVHMSYSGNGFSSHQQSETRYNPIESLSGARDNIWYGSQKLHRWAVHNLMKANESIIHLGLFNNQWEHDSKEKKGAEAYLGWLQSWLAEHDKIAGFKIPFSYLVPRTRGMDNVYLHRERIREDLATISDRPVIAIDPAETGEYDETHATVGVTYDGAHYTRAAFDELELQMWAKNLHRGILRY